MVSITTQAERRSIQKLPFCYLCGKQFAPKDSKNRDHVPPETIFRVEDRDPLILPTHTSCNSDHRLVDEKIGQLISLRYGKVPNDPRHRRLQITRFTNVRDAAVTNLDVDGAIWRWIAGFHAALYGEPALDIRPHGSLVTPFPKAQTIEGRIVFEPLKPQHVTFVQAIKDNRARGNIDRIHCNKGKLKYECVWHQGDNNGPWMCFFALDVYDWKDLGRTRLNPGRGCAGFYILPAGTVPSSAARGAIYTIKAPNYDVLDPFAP
jgi:hypothetical protein